MSSVKFIENDGGRADAGFKGHTGDCACRAVAIITGRPYREVYDELIEFAKRERPGNRRKRSHPRTGYHARTLGAYLEGLGFTWTATMHVGQGCKVHVKEDELPPGRVILRLSKHFAASIDGVIHDTSDPSFGHDGTSGSRCVYGYWTAPSPSRVRRGMTIELTSYLSDDAYDAFTNEVEQAIEQIACCHAALERAIALYARAQRLAKHRADVHDRDGDTDAHA